VRDVQGWPIPSSHFSTAISFGMTGRMVVVHFTNDS